MNHEQINIWGIIPAAGIGKRMGSTIPKQYLQLTGKTILQHSIEKLLNCDLISGVTIGVAEDDVNWKHIELQHPRLLGDYLGGVERIHTVLNGLVFLQNHASDKDWVLVHDAVRPCVEISDIEHLIQQGLKSNSGAILANKVVDTVKKINNEGQILQTLDRNELALALTPQLFPLKVLKKALTLAIENDQLSTDESAAVEALGVNPLIVEGKQSNIKITTPEDLELAEFVIDHSNSDA